LVKNFSRILVCPLDWGIGHATRCVPVIRQLTRDNYQVIIAADGRPGDFLRQYFPELEFIRLPGFRVSYPSGNNMALQMVGLSPGIFFRIYQDHKRLKKIIKDYKIDAVISDNRFGMWSKKVYSIYVTHQLMIKAPERLKWAEPMLYKAHQWIISHYNECWIPDTPGERNLSGDLGHKYPLPVNGHFVGILSRFDDDIRENYVIEKGPELLFLLSGPEPQRSIFEEIILKELEVHPQKKAVILRGLPGKPEQSSPLPGVISYNHLPDEEISQLIRNAGMIISRPGYSTIMDLVTLGRSAVLVPTQGQTEQEYLAGHLSKDGLFNWLKQDSFTLNLALVSGKKLSKSIDFTNERSLLEIRILDLKGRF
jgi:uncharacterized protein (TIGR00661 family)